jgi:hypothetical protein
MVPIVNRVLRDIRRSEGCDWRVSCERRKSAAHELALNSA